MIFAKHLTTWQLVSLTLIIGVSLVSNLHFRPYAWYTLVAIYVLAAVFVVSLVLLVIRLFWGAGQS